jgi:uncharacterized protein
MAPPPLPLPASPIPTDRRLDHLDALRGFALFGILLVNMNGLKTPLFSSGPGDLLLAGPENTFAAHLISVLASGKFIAIFSFLFGMGLAMQWRRWGAPDGTAFKRHVRRRMGVLLVLGILHGVLLWPGDILGVYAIIGLIGAGWVRRSTRFQLVFAAIFFALLTGLMMLGTYGMTALGGGTNHYTKEEMKAWLDCYQSTDIGLIIRARLREWGFVWIISLFFQISYALMFVLVGMAAGKLDAQALLESTRSLQPVQLIAAGVLFCLLGPIAEFTAKDSAVLATAAAGGQFIGSILTACGYAILAVGLFRSGSWPRLTACLTGVGRLSLSNYLFQSIAANVIFMGWGLGLYGKTSSFAGLGVSVGVFAVQVVLSQLWLRKFRSGPVEHLSRKLAYPAKKESGA